MQNNNISFVKDMENSKDNSIKSITSMENNYLHMIPSNKVKFIKKFQACIKNLEKSKSTYYKKKIEKCEKEISKLHNFMEAYKEKERNGIRMREDEKEKKIKYENQIKIWYSYIFKYDILFISSKMKEDVYGNKVMENNMLKIPKWRLNNCNKEREKCEEEIYNLYNTIKDYKEQEKNGINCKNQITTCYDQIKTYYNNILKFYKEEASKHLERRYCTGKDEYAKDIYDIAIEYFKEKKEDHEKEIIEHKKKIKEELYECMFNFYENKPDSENYQILSFYFGSTEEEIEKLSNRFTCENQIKSNFTSIYYFRKGMKYFYKKTITENDQIIKQKHEERIMKLHNNILKVYEERASSKYASNEYQELLKEYKKLLNINRKNIIMTKDYQKKISLDINKSIPLKRFFYNTQLVKLYTCQMKIYKKIYENIEKYKAYDILLELPIITSILENKNNNLNNQDSTLNDKNSTLNDKNSHLLVYNHVTNYNYNKINESYDVVLKKSLESLDRAINKTYIKISKDGIKQKIKLNNINEENKTLIRLLNPVTFFTKGITNFLNKKK